MSKRNLILVGLGARGHYWAEVINRSSDFYLSAYVDPNPAALEKASARFGIRPSFATLEQALEQITEVAGLVLATPPEGRLPHIALACQHKFPLLVEKPLALSLSEAAQFVSMAKKASVPLMVGLNFRYLGVTKALQGLIQSKIVGKPAFGHFTYERWRDGRQPHLNKYPLTMKHPMLWEQSIHHFDLMRFIYQSEPVSVYARTWNPDWSMYDDDTNVSAIFTFENGLTVNYQGTWQSGWQGPNFCWRTDCTEGVLIQNDQFSNLSYARRHDPSLTPVALPPHEIWVSDTEGLLDAFAQSLLHGAPLESSGQDHLNSLAMVEACIRSSESKQAVSIGAILNEVSTSISEAQSPISKEVT